MHKKDMAICIHSLDYSDTSQILTFFARDNGKFDAIAKGSKRPKSSFGGPIEIFSFGEVIFSEAGHNKLSSLSEFVSQPRFFAIRRNLGSLNCALFGAELVELLTDDFDPHPDLFDTFVKFLDDLQTSPNVLATLIEFQIAILYEIGQAPVLDRCVNCSLPYNSAWPVVFLSNSAHGLICRDCEGAFADKMNIPKDTAPALSDAAKLARLPEPTLNTVEKLLISYFTDMLHKPPKMSKAFLRI